MKLVTENKTINFEKLSLPDEARMELINFYEFLLYKYVRKKRRATDILKNIEQLSWKMGDKLYKSREELYER